MSREIPLSKGYAATVDDADYDRLIAAGPWHAAICGGKPYARHTLPTGVLYMHTFLTGYAITDHTNGDSLDNRRWNLRSATNAQNSANRGPSPAGTSGYKGVNLYRNGRWRAHVTVRDEHRHLGYYSTPEDAARAYDAAALETWGDFARLNFPQTQEITP